MSTLIYRHSYGSCSAVTLAAPLCGLCAHQSLTDGPAAVAHQQYGCVVSFCQLYARILATAVPNKLQLTAQIPAT